MDIDIDIKQPEAALPIKLDISTGVSYPILDNKPQINGIELVGNKTTEDLGLQPEGDYALRSELPSGGDYASKDDIPTKTSQLTNDSGFLTQHQDISGKQDKLIAGKNITIVNNVISSVGGVSDAYTKTETDNLLNGKQDKGDYALNSAIPTKVSQLENDLGYTTGAVDASNLATKEFAISASLPSARYTEMTLGASGSTVIAPENGYFHIDMIPGVTGAYVTLNNLTTGILLTNWTINSGDYARVLAPCRKGDEIKITYKQLKTLNKFRFYYPEGAE